MLNKPTPMPSLRELQLRVMHAIQGSEPDAAAECIAAHGISPAARLSVHADTARANFIASLVSSYPAVERLVGEDYFAQCARGFHRRHPSQSGDLQPAGRGFAQYLMELHGDDEYRYLGEVARLEWLIQETLLAADTGAFDLAKLGKVAPHEYDELRFQLHPSARLFASAYPCVHIWQANVQSNAEPEPIDLSEGPDRVLLMRSLDGELTFHRLSRGEERFLQALYAGERFGGAVDAGAAREEADALDAGAGFDAGVALRRFVVAGAIVDF
jgi:hypothetical protein